MFIHEQVIKDINKLSTYRERLYAAAIMYCEAGIPIVPLRPNTKILLGKSSGMNYHSCTTNIKTAEKWFHPKTGRYKNHNLGIVCGRENGVFAIDIDVHGRHDGFKTLTDLKQPKLDAPMQRTPSGGAHFLFLWQPNCTSSTGKIGLGIDTRGGDGLPRSHIVAWPSEVDGKRYEWVTGGDLKLPPQWVMGAMGESTNFKKMATTGNRGNENVGEADIERQYTLASIGNMLSFIKPDVLSYDQWLQVGQAINSQHPTDGGLELWDQWSSDGERYEVDECQRRWPGFEPVGPIRMGTLIHYAKEQGYNTEPGMLPLDRGDFSEVVEQMNNCSSVVLVGGKVKIAHLDPKGNVNILDKTDFGTLFMNQLVPAPNSKGAIVMMNKADIWLADEDRRTSYNGVGFFPDKELWYDGYVNLWKGWGVDPIKGDWSLIRDHIHNIICAAVDGHSTFVFDWIADLLQDPMRAKGTALVLHGHEGGGKGTLCDIIGKILGTHYKHVTHEEHLIGRFNSHLEDALLIFADEVVYGGSRKVAGVLKALVTEEDLVIERKGVGAYMHKNRARLIIASNEDWYIPAGAQSRRFFVLDINNDRANDVKYFNALYAEINNGGAEAMMYDLLNRDITSNLSKAPETKALTAQRQLYAVTGDSVLMWLAECTNKGDLGVVDDDNANGENVWPQIVDRMMLYEMGYKVWSEKKSARAFIKGPTHFYRKLREQGFISTRPKAAAGEIRRYAFKVPPLDNLRAAMGLNDED